MEKIWHHTFYNELKVVPDDHPVLVTEAPLNPKFNRERVTQMMFETFNVPALYIGMQGIMSLYTTGRTTGVVVDVGDGISHACPVFEGFALQHNIIRMDLAGSDLTDYLHKLLTDKGFGLTSSGEKDLVRTIKEEMCYVANSYESALAESSESAEYEKVYKLPDGQSITLGAEAFTCPEALFKPSLIQGKENVPSLPDAVTQSLQRCDVDVRKELANAVILSGGSTLFKGLPERLTRELGQNSTVSAYKIKVVAPPERQFSAWMGASVLASLSTLQQLWVSKHDYDECGPTVIHRKCF